MNPNQIETLKIRFSCEVSLGWYGFEKANIHRTEYGLQPPGTRVLR